MNINLHDHTTNVTDTAEFKAWFAAVKAEAERRGVADLLGSEEDHRDGFVDGEGPADEVQAQIDALHALS